MSRTRPFLGETTSREKAFPDIASLELTIIQDKSGYYTREPWQRETKLNLGNITRYFACANPRCQQGGLDLQQIVNFWPNGKQTFHCNGHEGSPKGRHKGNPCDNYFEIELSVVRTAKTPTA